MPHIIESLENALRLWEDNCLIVNLLSRAENKMGKKQSFPLQGPFAHFSEFRKYIIQSFQNFDSADFCQKFIEERVPDKPSLLGDLAELPFELCLWSHTSRRAYHLKTDLQLMLNATSIKNVYWHNVRLPFESFAVILDEPIIGTTVEQDYDCILVSSYEAYGHQIIVFRLFSSEIKNYEPLSEETKKRLQQLLKKGQFDKFFKALNKAAQAIPNNVYIPHFELPLTEKIKGTKVTESVIKLAKDFVREQNVKGIPLQIADGVVMPDEGNTAVRLVVGLCLFLTTKHARNINSYRYKPQKKNRQIISSPITNESDIFKLTLNRVLSLREKNSFSSGLKRTGGYTIDTHFRNGTWRFPANKATDPNAEKNIWVSPSIINPHLCTEGLPNGSDTKIKP